MKPAIDDDSLPPTQMTAEQFADWMVRREYEPEDAYQLRMLVHRMKEERRAPVHRA